MEQVAPPHSSSFPATTPNGKHPVVVNSVNWEQWLTTLRTLSADAPEWDGVGTFVKAVQQLSEAKRLERESGQRLRQALMTLAANHSDGLDFFGLTDEVLIWTGENYPSTEVSTLVESVEALQTLLGKHWELYRKPAAATLTEERARRHALGELEDDIITTYDGLARVFRTATAVSPTSSVPPVSPSNAVQPSKKEETSPAKQQEDGAVKQAKSPDGQVAPDAPPPSATAPTPAPAASTFKFVEVPAAKPRKPAAPTPLATPVATSSAPPVVPEVDNSHTHIDSAARQYNPLTRTQERQLNSIRSGIGLVFASEALGCSHIIEAYKRFTPTDVPEGTSARCREIPSKMTNSDQIEQWLEDYVQEHQPGTRLVAYRPLSNGTKEHLIEQVQAALDICKRPDKGQRPWLGVIFIFDPKATWSWLSLPPQYREAVEDEADVLTSPWRWNAAGIGQRLTHHHKMDTDEVCQQVLAATGGWPYLLDVLFYRCGTQNDPRPFAQTIEREITENSTKLVQQFRHCLGLDSHENPQKVLEFIHQRKQIPLNLDGSDIREEELPLPPAAYDATVEYLSRLGCLEVQGGQLSVEPIVARVLPQS